MMTQNLTYALEEKIGEPSLFCGRKQEMALLMNWINKMPKKMAKSRALLGRRKSGKTAIMQRIFNILWNQNDRILPFYFEVLDKDQWLLHFAADYYRTFMAQYLSFQTRTILPTDNKPWHFSKLLQMAKEIGDNEAVESLTIFQSEYEAEQTHEVENIAFGTPANFAGLKKMSVLVMIDEIQFMTKHIYHDREHKLLAHNLPGAFHGLVESKLAPMLVSGSYVGWMTKMIYEMFKGGRLKKTEISPKLSFDEGMEAVYRYAEYNEETVSDEGALIINLLTQSDPFYIASLLRSDWAERDFSSKEGVIKTLAYEVRNKQGELFGTWSEYIYSTIKEVNDQYAKQIILFLSKERYKECTRDEISDHLGGAIANGPLETKLRALEYGDLITRGTNNFRYSGIPDDILDLIFRDLYQEEIDKVKPDIAAELTAKVTALEKENKSLAGTLRELKGRMLELIVYRELNQCQRKQKAITHFKQRLRPWLNMPFQEKMEDILTVCSTSHFKTVWMNYYLQLPNTTPVEIDVLAEGEDTDSCWALMFEMKNRNENHLPTQTEAQYFLNKLNRVKQWLSQKEKPILFICPIYFSAEGFEPKIETWLHEQGIFTTDMTHWDI